MNQRASGDSCFHELAWVLRQGVVLWFSREPGLVRNAWAYVGALLFVGGGMLLLNVLIWIVSGLRHADARPFGWACELTIGAMLIVTGAAAVCFGTHRRPSSPGGMARRVAGADVDVQEGDGTATNGFLVIIGGYGSQSPAFCEPFFFTNPAHGAPDWHAILARFRWRLLLRLDGGFGWKSTSTLAIADSLEALLASPTFAESAALPSVVIAHSRGTQVVAATGRFRAPNWQRYAIHPPAGVNPLLRALVPLSPEIAEIQLCGTQMVRDVQPKTHDGADRLAGFPWTCIYQARGWDHTVLRFPQTPGRRLSNISPWGSHILPFAAPESRVWNDLQIHMR